MTDILQTLTTIITLASVYLLIGLGWNLVYNASGFLNLAIGEFYVLGAVLSFELQRMLGGGLPPALLAVVAVGALGLVADAALLRPLTERRLSPLIVTLGLSMVLLQLARFLIPNEVIRPTPLLAGTMQLAGVTVRHQEMLVWATAAAATCALWVFFTRTDAGRTMRACADDYGAARALGIRVSRYGTAAFAASAMLAAVAGVVVAPTQGITYNIGTLIAIKSFMAVSIGGIGRYGGAAVGALTVASAEALVARYWSSSYRDLVVLGGFLLVLYVRAVGRGQLRWNLRRAPAPRAAAGSS